MQRVGRVPCVSRRVTRWLAHLVLRSVEVTTQAGGHAVQSLHGLEERLAVMIVEVPYLAPHVL